MTLNYAVDTAIDPDDLVEEWLGLSSMFFNYQKQLAKDEERVKEVWEDLKVTRSRLVREIKEDNSKITAIELEAKYREHQGHQEAKKKLLV